MSKTRRKKRRKQLGPPPERSARLYVYINPSKVHMFRFLLEAEENLGIMTVVDRFRAALLIRFSPHQKNRIHEYLEEMKYTVAFDGPFEIMAGAAQI